MATIAATTAPSAPGAGRARPRHPARRRPRRHHPPGPAPAPPLGVRLRAGLPAEARRLAAPPGPGEAVLITDAEHATKVEFLLPPARGDPDDLIVRIGTDTNGRDAYMARWRYEDRFLSANLTVRATGPGGVTEKVVGVYHPDPGQP